MSPVIRSHWTPRYALDRTRLAIHQRRHPDDPWLTADAVHFLNAWLRPSDRCLEWGSGRSTKWLASRAANVVSIEHDKAWAERVAEQVASLRHVSVRLVDIDDIEGYADPQNAAAVDLALVDGVHRDRCALTAVDRVLAGGVIVVDNVERYLPSDSRGPEAIGPAHQSERWREFDDRTSTWHRYWTSDGVTDTAFFFKPPA